MVSGQQSGRGHSLLSLHVYVCGTEEQGNRDPGASGGGNGRWILREGVRELQVGGRISLAQTVVKVGARAFANTGDVEGVLLPMGVGSVGEGAFENCSGSRGI